MSARAGRLRAATGTLAGAAAMITLVTIASRLVGFARSLVQSAAVGTEGVGSAYTAANLLPNVLFEVAAGGALAGAVVPLLAGPIARRAGTDVSRIASALLGWTLVVLVPLGALLALLAQPIASLLMLAKHPELVDVTATFVRVFALQVPLYGLAVVLGSILQAHKRFFWQAFSPLLSSLAVIVVFLVFARLADGDQADVAALSGDAIAWLGWGTTAGVAVLALPLVLPVHRLGVRLRPTLRFPGGEAVRARNLAFAGIGALVAQQLSVLAIMGAAYRYGPEQTFPTYWFAQQVYLLPYAVLAFPLATSAFPRLAEHVAHARHDAYRRLLATTTRTLIVVAGLGAAALIAASAAVEAVFAHIATGSVAGLGGAVAGMAVGIVGFSLILHLSRALYAIDRQRVAVVVTAAGWLVVAATAYVLPAVTGVRDQAGVLLQLGLATAVGMSVAGAGLLLATRRHAGPEATHGVPRTLLVVAAGVALGALGGSAVSGALLPDDAGWLPAVGVGALAALVAGAVVVGVSLVGDRPALLGVLRRGPGEGTPTTEASSG
ncbi:MULTISPECIES: murein biosynthesis integral membrane protein MurJ [Cellulosimicrobium]|uniref:murein biosynthesis integral membrane protein MurJ n=1 Tax=Cellulosimicrobium TaxID=157920 RepID=UPI002097AD9E|nr:lipid II flippase MurJ [Cellulosimicrobium cellulans]MCO7271552.1 virulence factor MviN [Cellulosimicrobium cellulans]